MAVNMDYTPENIVRRQIMENNSWSAEQAFKQMQFQERMSNNILRGVFHINSHYFTPFLARTHTHAHELKN